MGGLWATAQRLAAQHGYCGPVDTRRPPSLSGGKRGAAVAHLTGITMAILWPTGAFVTILATLGGERSIKIGAAEAGTDLQSGDEIHVGSTVYVIDGMQRTPDMVYCALSEVDPKGRAFG